LTRELINIALKYYKFKFNNSDYAKWENHGCFSQPSLELHECNARVKLPGKRECKFCKHNIDRPCDISCDFQTFCLAVYAWRLGIGGEDLYKAVQRNLYKITPDQLYDEVISKLVGSSVEEMVAVESELESDPESEDPVIPEQPDGGDSVVSEVGIDNNSITLPSNEVGKDKYYTIPEAAKVLKKSLPYVYVLLRGGQLREEKFGEKRMVTDESVKEYIINSKSRKRGKKHD
jgi:excisionase family DNA binding protein